MTQHETDYLPPCPAWCRYDAPDHGFMGETGDWLYRYHFSAAPDPIEAEQDQPDEHGQQPYVDVALQQREWETADPDLPPKRDAVVVTVYTQGYPHLTLSEARRLIAELTAAVELGDRLAR